MPDLYLEPDPEDAAPDGMIIDVANAPALLQKVSARVDHYADLHIAKGEDWLVLFSVNAGVGVTLPWPGGSALYLRRLGDGCYCQNGYRPNVPEGLHQGLGAHLVECYGLRPPVALVAGNDVPKLYELGPSRRVGDMDFGVLV